MRQKPWQHLALGLITATLLINGTGVLHAEASKTVTYKGGYQRLHTITDDLSKLTGVKIDSGRTTDDWKVRDIPLIVYANDVPLDKLLNGLAITSHCLLKSEPNSYRIDRDVILQGYIDRFYEEREEAMLSEASWAWDTLAAYSSMPEKPVTIAKVPLMEFDGPYKPPVEVKEIRVVGSFLASLDPIIRQKAFSGEPIELTVKNSPNPEAYLQLFKYACTTRSAGITGHHPGKPAEPNENEIADSVITIRVSTIYEPILITINNLPILVETKEVDSRYNLCTAEFHPIELAKLILDVPELNLPAQPYVESSMKYNQSPPPVTFVKVDSEEGRKLPILQKKVTIKLPRDDKFHTRQEVLAQLAEQSGLAIVCEDFRSQKMPFYARVNVEYPPHARINTILSSIDLDKDNNKLEWYIDESSKLLIGWQKNWFGNQLSLVPEKMLTNLAYKRSTTGAELDDIAPVLGLTPYQVNEWINWTPDYGWWKPEIFEPLWKLYDVLPKDKKTVAKSKDGLKLSEINTVKAAWACKNAVNWSRLTDSLNGNAEQQWDEYIEPLINPEMLSQLTMKVVEVTLNKWEIWNDSSKWSREPIIATSASSGQKKHTYKIQLDGVVDGKVVHIESTLHNVAFPLFTIERERQLAKIDAKSQEKL